MGLQIPGGKRGKISRKVQGACLKEGYHLKQATSKHMRAAWDKQPDNKQEPHGRYFSCFTKLL